MTEADPTEEEQQTAADAAPEADEAPLSLEQLQAKADLYLANWQRTQADFENYRKKTDQEKQELATFANAMLVSGMLSTLDDLERAFDTLDADLAGLTWVEGLKLIYRKLLTTLEGQGLNGISAVGEPFDPSIHEAESSFQVRDITSKVFQERHLRAVLRFNSSNLPFEAAAALVKEEE